MKEGLWESERASERERKRGGVEREGGWDRARVRERQRESAREEEGESERRDRKERRKGREGGRERENEKRENEREGGREEEIEWAKQNTTKGGRRDRARKTAREGEWVSEWNENRERCIRNNIHNGALRVAERSCDRRWVAVSL